MLDEKLDQLAALLEKQEMETTNVSPALYMELLAAYIYQGDYINANFLWKRIPAGIKANNKELERMHQIFRSLQDSDLPTFYKAMEFDWSRNTAEIMFELKNKVKTECINTVGRTYCTIFQSVLMNLANLSPEMVAETCQTMGWQVIAGADPIIVIPKPTEPPKMPLASAEEQLTMLTDFISFLEN